MDEICEIEYGDHMIYCSAVWTEEFSFGAAANLLRIYLWWSLCTLYYVPTRVAGESYRRQVRSVLLCCDVFRVLINSLVC